MAGLGGPETSGDAAGHRRLGCDETVVVELARGRPYAEIAEVAGVSVRTIERRARDPRVLAAVAAHRAVVIEDAAAEMRVALREAVGHVRGVLNDDAQLPAIRLKASALIMAQAGGIMSLDLAERHLAKDALTAEYDLPTEDDLAFLVMCRTLAAARRRLDDDEFLAFVRRWEQHADDGEPLCIVADLPAPAHLPSLLPGLFGLRAYLSSGEPQVVFALDYDAGERL